MADVARKPPAARRTELWRKTKPELIRMYRSGITTPSGSIARYGGGAYPIEQWSKGDVIASIMAIEYPPEAPV